MVRKSRAKRRGFSQGVQKYKIRLPAFGTEANPVLLPEKYLDLIRLAARICWIYLGVASWIFFLIPLKRKSDGSFEVGSKLRQILHNALFSVGVAFMIHKFFVMICRIIFEDLDLLTYMCISAFMVYFVAAAGAIGSTWKFGLMEEMMTSWNPNATYLEEVTGERVTLFDSISACIKIIGITWAVHVAAFNASALSLFFDELPVCVFYILKNLPVIPANDWSIQTWQLLAYPIEFASMMGPMYICGLNISAGVLGLGLLRTYVDKMRNMAIHDMEDWNRLELVYKCMRIYNTIFMNWLKFVLMPVIFSLCVTIVVLFYVSLHPSNLPFIVYIWFPLVAVVVLIILSWLWYDVVMLKRIGEEVRGNLQKRTHRFCIPMNLEEKRLYLRRGRSHRLVTVTIGEFSEITIEGLMDVWEEIFNQLLFLLTL